MESTHAARHTNELPARQATLFVAMLAVLIGFNLMDRQLLAIVAEPVKHEFKLSDTQLGILTGPIFAVVFTIASIPIAWAADRVNRVGILTVCAALWAVCTASMSAVVGFAQIAIVRVGLALSEAGCNPCAQSLIADYVRPVGRGQAMAIYVMGGTAGIIIAGIVGGLLNDAVGWRTMFAVLGAVSLVAAFAAWWVLPEPRRTVAVRSTSSPTGFRVLLRKRAFQNLLIGVGLVSIAIMGSLVWGMVFVVRYLHWTPGQAGAIVGTLVAVVGLGGTWLGGKSSDHLMRRDVRWPLWLPVVGLILATPFGVVAAFSTAAMVLLLAVSGEAFLRTLASAPLAATLQRLAPNDARARAAASLGIVTNLVGLGLGPFIVGRISDALTPAVGADALRYGLAFLMVPQLAGAYFLWRAARTLGDELAE